MRVLDARTEFERLLVKTRNQLGDGGPNLAIRIMLDFYESV